MAISFCSNDDVKAMKIPEPTTPIPKPPGNVSSTSHVERLPCQRTIISTYETHDASVASTMSVLYRAVRRISRPAMMAPMAFPTTGGKRYDPARALLALVVMRK